MTRPGVTLEGEAEFLRALEDFSEDQRKEVSKALDATGLMLRTDIIKRYNKGPATGETYKRGAITHVASSEGQAPMTDTGDLARGTMFKKDDGDLSAEVFNTTKTKNGRWFYGFLLEFGTRRIKERPAWRPAVEEMRPKFIKLLEGALRKAAR